MSWTKAEYDRCPELASRLHRRILDAQDDRDRHIRAFNSLEKAVTNHVDQCPDCDDLARAHRTVMRLLAEGVI